MKRFGRYSVLIATLALLALLFSFFRNLDGRFRKVEADYKAGRAINLSGATDADSLSMLLVNHGYVDNVDDADYISQTLVERAKKEKYSFLYILQKRKYGQVPAREADSLGRLTKQLENSRRLLGQDTELPALETLDNTLDLGSANGGKIIAVVKDDDGEPCKDVVVRLTEHYADTQKWAHTKVLGYAKTDASGKACFIGLDTLAYSVLPIKLNYEYGSEKGVKQGGLRNKAKEVSLSFVEWEHRIRMFSDYNLRLMKQDGFVTVRTPAEYKAIVIKWFLMVVAAWWVLALFLKFRKKNFDPWLIAAALFLTGLCVIIMFAIQNPLTEELRGVEMASGVLIGLAAVFVLQFVDFLKLYQQKYIFGFDIPLTVVNWLFMPFKQKVSRQSAVLKSYYPFYRKFWALLLIALCSPLLILDLLRITRLSPRVEAFFEKLPKGIGWFFLALLLTLLLWTPLAGIIGGMRVNLVIGGLTFQPSEIAKYLILFFVAAFFTQKADAIIQYSMPNKTKLWEKVKTLSWVICGLIALMGLYAVLGDMGPGLVIGITFVILYSLIKSKVNLDNLKESDKWIRILTCDFAMMIYGVLSFALFIALGAIFDLILVMGLLWFVAWILLGLLRKKQFYETAFIINMLIFMFVFGGKVMNSVPGLQGSSLADRFEKRTAMCTNTWGVLEYENDTIVADPVSNTQVANGLWAIASGGTTGQGLGNGNPSVIPAFHTDMILSSMAEQLGFWGLVAVVLVLGLLLRRIAVVGYRAGHPFAFYFCMGVAIVTGVQFFIISLGGSGMIPLTGITVPFMSYGRVSMILNLVAFGVVLSMSQNVKRDAETKPDAVADDVVRHNVGEYNYPVSIVSWTFVALALINLWTWYFYASYMRENTMIHYVYVQSDNDNRGLPIVEYNPRITMLTRAMYRGNIYDRKGVLIATSDKSAISDSTNVAKYLECGIEQQLLDSLAKSRHLRLYPFGEHLYFMLGDSENGLYLSYNENNPYGYVAENQHLSYLRDFDTKPMVFKREVPMHSKDRFLKHVNTDTVIKNTRYDYSELVDYLKDGAHGYLVAEHNKAVHNNTKCRLDLTIDAKLQANLQDSMDVYLSKVAADILKKYDHNVLRASVVVLDAKNGDLLASANYPKPDYKRLREEDKVMRRAKIMHDTTVKQYYYDYYRDKNWVPYTDMDLGMVYQTPPGSTAKLMSAMAGFQKMGVNASKKKYLITSNDIIENGVIAKEPHQGWSYPRGKDSHVIDRVDMKLAIVESSNCYFMNLVNENDLYHNLDSVYETVGVRVGNFTPYFFKYDIDEDVRDSIRNLINENERYAVDYYKKGYVEQGKYRPMTRREWKWAWGQGYTTDKKEVTRRPNVSYDLKATPLNMARVASAVVNGGMMPTTQYVLDSTEYGKSQRDDQNIRLIDEDCAKVLYDYMLAEAKNQYYRNFKQKYSFPEYVGGKTGTPERTIYYKEKRQMRKKIHNVYQNVWDNNENVNDGWYVFFIDNERPLAVAVRLERHAGSGEAVKMAKNVVLEVLKQNNYIDNQEDNTEKQ